MIVQRQVIMFLLLIIGVVSLKRTKDFTLRKTLNYSTLSTRTLQEGNTIARSQVELSWENQSEICNACSHLSSLSRNLMKSYSFALEHELYCCKNGVLTMWKNSLDSLILKEQHLLHITRERTDDFIQIADEFDYLKRLKCQLTEGFHHMAKRLTNSKRFLQNATWWQGCYDGQNKLNTLKIGIAITSKTWKELNNNEKLERINAVFNNVNLVFRKQLNIQIVVDEVFLSSANEQAPKWNNENCELDLIEQLDLFQKWEKPSIQATWHLIDDCVTPFYDGSYANTGFSTIGTLCEKQAAGVNHILFDTLWLTIAHQLGHNFGAFHTLGLGGIMDFDDGMFEGTYQFHSNNKDDMCRHINTLKGKSKCSSWSLNNGTDCFDTPPPTGVILNGEGAECFELADYCDDSSLVREICPVTCETCPELPTRSPSSTSPPEGSIAPTSVPTISPSHNSRSSMVYAEGGGISDGVITPCKIPFFVDGVQYLACASMSETAPYLDDDPLDYYPFEPSENADKSKWCAINFTVYLRNPLPSNLWRRREWGYCNFKEIQPVVEPPSVIATISPAEFFENRTSSGCLVRTSNLYNIITVFMLIFSIIS